MRFHSYCFLFVFVMPVGGEYKDNYLGIVNFIYKTMLLCDMATPLIGTVTTQLFWVPRACTRMFSQFGFQFQQFLKSIRFVLLQSGSIENGLFLVLNLVRHQLTRLSRSSIVSPSCNS